MHRLQLNSLSAARRTLLSSKPSSSRLCLTSHLHRSLATAASDDVLRKSPSPVDAFVNSNNSYYIEESSSDFSFCSSIICFPFLTHALHLSISVSLMAERSQFRPPFLASVLCRPPKGFTIWTSFHASTRFGQHAQPCRWCTYALTLWCRRRIGRPYEGKPPHVSFRHNRSNTLPFLSYRSNSWYEPIKFAVIIWPLSTPLAFTPPISNLVLLLNLTSSTTVLTSIPTMTKSSALVLAFYRSSKPKAARRWNFEKL